MNPPGGWRAALQGWQISLGAAALITVILGAQSYRDGKVYHFDPETLSDRSTYDNGRELAAGMEHVLVNGELVLHAGQRTSALPGRGLRRQS